MSHIPRYLLIFFCALLFFFQAVAQNVGINPNKQDWRSIPSEIGKVIYPSILYPQANYITNLLEHQRKEKRNIGDLERRLPIMLHNQTMESNGYVALAPFQSEFFGTPPQSLRQLGSPDWLSLLSIHEYRHVLQMSNSRRGATKVASWIFGELGWSALTFMALPNWYFEGDAVISETLLSKGGRGRMPFFTLNQRCLSLADRTFSYSKIRNGSFKHWVPNHYPWGYTMLSHLHNEKGAESLVRVMENAAAYKSPIYPFSRALKKESGWNTKQLYKASWNSSQNLWNERLKERKLDSAKVLSQTSGKTPQFYFFPQKDETGRLLVWKNSFKHTDQIIRLDNGKEKVVVAPGFTFDPYFHYLDSQLVWTEIDLDARRARKQFSNIIHYHLKDKKRETITKNGRYSSPILSQKGNYLYALKFNYQLQMQLVKIDLRNREENVLYDFGEHEYVSRLAESKTGELYVILKKNHQLAIHQLNLSNKELKQISPWTAHTLDDIRIEGDYLYFTASFNQIDNLYRISINEKEIEQLTEVATGAYHPFYDAENQQVVFTLGNEKGVQLAQLPLQVKQTLNAISEPIHQTWQLQDLSEQKEDFLDQIPDSLHEDEAYHNHLGEVQIHSWSINATPAVQNFQLQFENYLKDFQGNAGGGYNFNEEGAFYQAQMVYGKWFPQINFAARRSFRSYDFIDSEGLLFRQDAPEDRISLGASVPLRKLKGNYQLTLNPSINYAWVQTNSRFRFAPSTFHLLESSISLAALKRRATQNLAPKLGFSTSLRWDANLQAFSEDRLAIETILFFPGLFANHGFQISGAYQNESLENPYQWSDLFNYARGYSSPLNDNVIRFSLDYQLPILYPDFGLAGISYFKRIRANLFFDYTERSIVIIDRTTELKSTGFELIFDNVWFNLAELSVGIRNSYLLDDFGNEREGAWNSELFIQTNF